MRHDPVTRASVVWLLCCVGAAASCARPTSWPSTGVVRDVDMTVTYGDHDVRIDAAQTLGTFHGYLIDGQFLGPTIVGDAGDLFDVHVDNQTNDVLSLTPTGMSYDDDMDASVRAIGPGMDASYLWAASTGPGTFLYRSDRHDDLLDEYQAHAGVLGAIVVRDPQAPARDAPDAMLTLSLLELYQPWFAPPAAVEEGDPPIVAHTAGAFAPHLLVVQEVTPRDDGWTTTTQPLLTAHARVGDRLHVSVLGGGYQTQTLHLRGLPWFDASAGVAIDTRAVTTWESFGFTLPPLARAGRFTLEARSPADDRVMTATLLVE